MRCSAPFTSKEKGMHYLEADRRFQKIIPISAAVARIGLVLSALAHPLVRKIRDLTAQHSRPESRIEPAHREV